MILMMKTKILSNTFSLLGLRVRSNEIYHQVDAADLVCFIVWDLKSEFFFKCHHNLHSIQTV